MTEYPGSKDTPAIASTIKYAQKATRERNLQCEWRREHEAKEKYLPLEFDAGTDAQVDWGEGIVILGGESVTAQLFMIRSLVFEATIFLRATFAPRGCHIRRAG